MRFELFVATRYLRAKRRQAFIGVITGISILGVAAGVASLIVALAVNNGFRQDLQARLLGSTAHISLLRVESDGIRDWRPLLEKLSKQPHVVAAAPAIYEQVLISRGPRARGAVLKGMLPQYERNVSDLLQTVTLGSAAALEEEPVAGTGGVEETRPTAKSDASTTPAGEGARSTHAQSPDDLAGVQERVATMPPVILGKDMAEEIGATVGSVVLVTSPQGELTPFGMVPKYIRFRVAGIFNSGFFDYDSSWAFIRLSDAQELFGLGDVISVIQFKLDDIYLAGDVARSLEQAADLISGSHGFMATSWMEQNKPLFRALRLERVVTFITIGLIVFVAALNILISLIMMVMEKTKDIAVLMSLGTKKRQIRRVFIAQGVLIGVIGTAIGLVVGYAISWAGGHYHFISLSPEVYSIGALGISSETSADFGKERRTNTIAPPAEMLMAVANSRESLPPPSRLRTNTGIASCNRAHLRSSFFDTLRRTCIVRDKEVVYTPKAASQGPNSEAESSLPEIKPNLATHTGITKSDFKSPPHAD